MATSGDQVTQVSDAYPTEPTSPPESTEEGPGGSSANPAHQSNTKPTTTTTETHAGDDVDKPNEEQATETTIESSNSKDIEIEAHTTSHEELITESSSEAAEANCNTMSDTRPSIHPNAQQADALAEALISASSEATQAKRDPQAVSIPVSIDTSLPDEQDDLSRLHSVCTRLISLYNQSQGKDVRLDSKDDSILKLLVSDDMSNIRNFDVLHTLFIEYIYRLPPKTISEVLSVLIATIKKSVFHFESCRGLMIPSIKHLMSDSLLDQPNKPGHDGPSSLDQRRSESINTYSNVSLTKHFLSEWINLLITHSCDVEELKTILELSQREQSLLKFVQQANLRQRNRPAAYFAFPGTRGSMMSLPPFQKWPNQLGWTFNTWFYLEPKPCAQPYLFNFKTGKSGLGYSAHFTGNCLVLTSIRVKGKGIQHCIPYEFPSYKWIHCAITYHSKWRASEIRVYVNGQLPATIELPWQVQTNEIFDKCFIGGSGTIGTGDRSGDLNSFCGQMSAIYLFNEGLSPAQICAIHRLGPSYMGQFKYSNESHVNLPPRIIKSLYEEKLASSLFCLFTPVAVDSGTLCIQLAPLRSSTTTSVQNYFISAPHAALLGETKSIVTQPIYSTLQSLGCTQSLLPILDRYASEGNAEACVTLIRFLCDLIEYSPHWFANEIVQTNGFVIVACSLARNPKALLTGELLDVFINLIRTLLTASNNFGDSILIKHFMDNILFNPNLWVYAETSQQIKLYNYLANEFLHGTRRTTRRNIASGGQQSQNPAAPASSINQNSTTSVEDHESSNSIMTDLLFGEIRRVSTVLQSLHSLKHYYWMAEEPNVKVKARNGNLRPSHDDIAIIRSYIIQFTEQLIVRANSVPLDEVQGILNYLASCSHPNNLVDVLAMLTSLLKEHSHPLIVALEQKQGIKVIFSLISSQSSERVRIEGLKLLTLFLAHCTHKKKQEIMGPGNLFMLIHDKLKVHKPLTLATYEALLDLMLENIDETELKYQQGEETTSKRGRSLSKFRIENSILIKVIASLIRDDLIESDVSPLQTTKHYTNIANSDIIDDEMKTQETVNIRTLFINDLWNLIVSSRDNRRIILQMSVWQHWFINLIKSTIHDSQLIRNQVLAIFRVLLYHAIRYEYGGWRVWIDTLAIIHTKISYDEFYEQQAQFDQNQPQAVNQQADNRVEQTKPIDETISKCMAIESPTQQSSSMITQSIADEANDPQADHNETKDDLKVNSSPTRPTVSSISDLISAETNRAQVGESNNNEGTESKVENSTELDSVDCPEKSKIESVDGSMDSVDLAPTRSFRKSSLKKTESESETSPGGLSQSTMTSIPLDEPTADKSPLSISNGKIADETDPHLPTPQAEVHRALNSSIHSDIEHNASQTQKAMASPAFRIPEFKWTNVLVKLLNDLLFSIECDFYNWRASSNKLDSPAFAPKHANNTTSSGTARGSASSASGTQSKDDSSSSAHLEALLQKPEVQVYIVNVIHLITQLADNIILAAGGLLPLLADATGGNRSSSSTSISDSSKLNDLTEGLTTAQANSLLYRLTSMVDIVIFAASHVNLSELEADKNTTSGGILRQCLRLACTVTVKNCLIIRGLNNRIETLGISLGENNIIESEFPNDFFDSYHGCSLLSANGLFKNSVVTFENDLVENLEYSPNQTPDSATSPSLLPFQSNPIKNPNKLMQLIDIRRIQACIYHDMSTESRQSQFLALSSLYFISVLMVSKYRDIIEPKPAPKPKPSNIEPTPSTSSESPTPSTSSTATDKTIAATITSAQPAVSNVESNLLNFGRMQPTVAPTNSTAGGSALTDMLTRKLENALDTVCPLLKSIMCDFCTFLSKTLIGSHGQDLVNKEADRAFRKANTSPVELVMLLCSQEWQNTLQKNAGLAFIELINEGRVLSISMKDHILRVAMEAEFILSRLRADDVAKHEAFGLASAETQTARLHEEALINSLISSAARRDYSLYCKFKEQIRSESVRNHKLDIWEDDDRRKRRFLVDSWEDHLQLFFSDKEIGQNAESTDVDHSEKFKDSKTDTKRILELQQTIDMGGIDDHCSPAGANSSASRNHDLAASNMCSADDDCDEDPFEDDDHNSLDSNSPDSDTEHRDDKLVLARRARLGLGKTSLGCDDIIDAAVKNRDKPSPSAVPIKSSNHSDAQAADTSGSAPYGVMNDSKGSNSSQAWAYDECSSINELTGSVIFAAECSLVWSIYSIPGIFQLTNNELYFEPNQNIIEAIDALKKEPPSIDNDKESTSQFGPSSMATNSSNESQQTLRKIDLRVLGYCNFLTSNGKISFVDIRAIFSRHYLLQPHALEIFVAQRSSVMFAFPDLDTVKRAVKYLPPVGVGIKYGIPQTRRASLMSPRQLYSASNMTQKWQRREIGNFQYLMFLNTIAGRTYQDFNQYPVFPWILTNYESEELDLNSPSNFRDLSKPVGALNSERRSEFVERYQTWDNPKVPAFHYGTHYSTAAFTLNWLCRLRGTFNLAYLALQDGKYEEQSRLFLSIADSWVSSLTGGQQNVKELIPEFFYLPEMFQSNLGLPEVEFPPWAKNGEQFVRLHRLALESELVSCQLHQWVDLIFGYKQRGPEAINAVNTFYYLTYQGNVNLNMIQDSTLREAIEAQIKHFGQTPSQLTTEPHPPRFSALHVSPSVFSQTNDEIYKVVKFPFNNSVIHIAPCVDSYRQIGSGAVNQAAQSGDGSSPGTIASSSSGCFANSILTITSNNQYQIHNWNSNDQSGNLFTIDTQYEHGSSSRRQLVDVDDLCSGISVKLSPYDGPSNDFKQEIQWPSSHFVVTLDGRFIIVGSFYDNSFRVFSTSNGRLCQVIYGHRAPVTCIVRSEGNAAADFYVATGSQDCSLLLWTWNEKYAQIEGSGVSAVHNPLPKLTINGHRTPVLSAVICAELGLIISGSKNLILAHTTTNGESLLEIDVLLPQLLDRTRLDFGRRMSASTEGSLSMPLRRPQVKDKERTILEASMLGEGSQSNRTKQQQSGCTINRSGSSVGSGPRSLASPSLDCPSMEKFVQLRELCNGDYYVSSLQLARELAFIVCVALPPPVRKTLPRSASRCSASSQSNSYPRHRAALLMTFNLRGCLMEATTIGQAVNGPRLGDVCLLSTSRDGEHLIINDSPTTLKIFRTFDLQPIYAYNTNDIPATLSDEQNRVKSLCLVDLKFILVGLESGKLVVYNADFKNL